MYKKYRPYLTVDYPAMEDVRYNPSMERGDRQRLPWIYDSPSGFPNLFMQQYRAGGFSPRLFGEKGGVWKYALCGTLAVLGFILFMKLRKSVKYGAPKKNLRIVIGGPPHSGKSTFMNMVEDKFKEYGIGVELLDLDLSAPTALKEGFKKERKKVPWDEPLAKEAQSIFKKAEGEVILGDSVGLISNINEIISKPADVAILLVSGSHSDVDKTYKKVVNKWKRYYKSIDKKILVVVRSSMNPKEESMFDPHDDYGVIVGLYRKLYGKGLHTDDACVEGIVFEIAQKFDYQLKSKPTPAQKKEMEKDWPVISKTKTWSPPPGSKLAEIETDYFKSKKGKKSKKKYSVGIPNDGGDCFQAAGQFILDKYYAGHADGWELVHGLVTGTGGPNLGKRFDHAWLERDGLVYDKKTWI